MATQCNVNTYQEHLAIPEKIQAKQVTWVRTWKKQVEIPESIKKEVDFLGVIKKKLYGFSIGLSIGLRFLGISRGESLFSKDNVTNI